MRKPSFEPCIPTRGTKVPDRPEWLHEIKHDGYRLIVQREGQRVRLFTRNGHDWADRFPSIVEAAARLEAHSFLIDGEVVIAGEDGMSDFRALRSKRRGPEAVLFAFDLLQHDGADLRENLSSAPYHRARASKSFPSRICGRLGGSDGRWFLPRTHR